MKSYSHSGGHGVSVHRIPYAPSLEHFYPLEVNNEGTSSMTASRDIKKKLEELIWKIYWKIVKHFIFFTVNMLKLLKL